MVAGFIYLDVVGMVWRVTSVGLVRQELTVAGRAGLEPWRSGVVAFSFAMHYYYWHAGKYRQYQQETSFAAGNKERKARGSTTSRDLLADRRCRPVVPHCAIDVVRSAVRNNYCSRAVSGRRRLCMPYGSLLDSGSPITKIRDNVGRK